MIDNIIVQSDCMQRRAVKSVYRKTYDTNFPLATTMYVNSNCKHDERGISRIGQEEAKIGNVHVTAQPSHLLVTLSPQESCRLK